MAKKKATKKKTTKKSGKKTSRKTSKKSGKKTSKKKSPYTKASKYVREEMHEYKHGAAKRKRRPIKSSKQAVAIGLSIARKKGIKVPKKSKRKAS